MTQYARARRARQQKIAVWGILMAIFALLAGTLAFSSSNSSSTSASTTSLGATTTTAPATTTTLNPATLSPVGQELYALIQTGRAGKYHARYALTGSGVPPTATAATLEVWRDGGRVRQETRLEQPSGASHTINIGGPEGTISCNEQPGITLACQQVSKDPLKPDDDFLAAITDRLSPTATIDVRDDTIGSAAVRCYVVNAADATNKAEVCLDAAGVPLRLDSGGLNAVLDARDDAVDPSLFLPPAPVSGG